MISRVLRGSACQVKYTAVKRYGEAIFGPAERHAGTSGGPATAETGRGGARCGEQADERVGGSVTLVGDSRHDPVGGGPQAHPDRGLAVADPVGHGLAYRAYQVVDLDAAEVGGSGDVEHAAAG